MLPETDLWLPLAQLAAYLAVFYTHVNVKVNNANKSLLIVKPSKEIK